MIDGVRHRPERDGATARFLNLHLGARDPEPGKKKLFFANPGRSPSRTRRAPASRYVVSAGSDLLVKLNVAADGTLALHRRRRHDPLHRPERPGQPGHQRRERGQEPAGHRHQRGRHARLCGELRLAQRLGRRPEHRPRHQGDPDLACRRAGSPGEINLRRRGDVLLLARQLRPAGDRGTCPTTRAPVERRLADCSSCHFKGLTDGVVWQFNAGPRKCVPLNATFNPHNPNAAAGAELLGDLRRGRGLRGQHPQRLRARAPLAGAGPVQRARRPSTSTLDPNHGLLIGDNGDVNIAAVRAQRVRQGERRAPAAHGHPAGRRRDPGARRAARVGAQRRAHAERPARHARRGRGRRPLAPTSPRAARLFARPAARPATAARP